MSHAAWPVAQTECSRSDPVWSVIDASIPEETTTPMDHDRQLRHTKLESPGQPRMRPIYLGFVALAIVVTHRLTRPDESGLDAHTKTTDVPVIGESRSG